MLGFWRPLVGQQDSQRSKEMPELGKGRKAKAQAKPQGGGGPSRTTIVIVLVAVVFVAGFGALIWWDSNSSTGPPSDVQEFDVGEAGRHTDGNVDYEQSPPVGGEHNPVWQNAAFYDKPIRNENAVHTLEHGAVWIAYSPDLSQADKDAIRDKVEGRDCLMASPYPDLPADTPVVASAWGVQVGLEGPDDPDLDRFIQSYRRGPQTPEPGAACTGGIADTV